MKYVAISVMALSLIGTAACEAEDEEQKKRDALILETKKTDVGYAVVKCDDAFSEVANSRTRQEISTKDRFKFLAQGLERTTLCLDGVEKELQAAGTMDLKFEPGKKASALLGSRRARVAAEAALVKEIDLPQNNWFLSKEGVVFKNDDARQRALAALGKYKTAHATLKASGDEKWQSEYFWEQAPHLLVERSVDQPDWKAAGVSQEMATEFLKTLQAKHQDGKAFAQLAVFPLPDEEGKSSFKDSEALLESYERVVQHYVHQALKDAGPESLYADSAGVSVGHGTLWFRCPKDQCDKASDLRIIQLL